MFFYLSFLRPPPLNSILSTPITITPHIANDLRTELFEGSQDVYYSWCQILSRDMQGLQGMSNSVTRPAKLTTWRQSSAYKELSVPLPPGLRDGHRWRLILSSSAQDLPAHVIDLTSSRLGKTPFPVMSMPISFHSRHVKASASTKQEQIERVYRLNNGSSEKDNLLMTVREQTSYDLDKKIWDSGIGLSSWIVELFEESFESDTLQSLSKLKDVMFAHDRRNILELGAGTGILALTIGALRSSLALPDAGLIITSDLPSAIPLLEHNISTNAHIFPSATPQAAILDWDEDPPAGVSSIQGGFDAIVMADVTYNTSSFPALIRTLSNLIKLNQTALIKPPLILLGYKERDPEERTLWEMARGVGIIFERIGERRGTGGNEVEVWIGQVEV